MRIVMAVAPLIARAGDRATGQSMLTGIRKRRVWMATEPVDLRKGFEGRGVLVERRGMSLYSGELLAFLSKRCDAVKVPWWNRCGLCPFCKRLARGLFPPAPAPSGQAHWDSNTCSSRCCQMGWSWGDCAVCGRGNQAQKVDRRGSTCRSRQELSSAMSSPVDPQLPADFQAARSAAQMPASARALLGVDMVLVQSLSEPFLAMMAQRQSLQEQLREREGQNGLLRKQLCDRSSECSRRPP